MSLLCTPTKPLCLHLLSLAYNTLLLVLQVFYTIALDSKFEIYPAYNPNIFTFVLPLSMRTGILIGDAGLYTMPGLTDRILTDNNGERRWYHVGQGGSPDP